MGESTDRFVMFVCPSCEDRVLRAVAVDGADAVTCPNCGHEACPPEQGPAGPPVQAGAGGADGSMAEIHPFSETPTDGGTDPSEHRRSESTEVGGDHRRRPRTVERGGPALVDSSEAQIPTPERTDPPEPGRDTRPDAELEDTPEEQGSEVRRVDVAHLIDEFSSGGRPLAESERPTPDAESRLSTPRTELSDPDELFAQAKAEEEEASGASPSDSQPVGLEEMRASVTMTSREIRAALVADSYMIRVGESIYGPAGVEEVLPLVENGLLVAADAISTDGGPWMPLSDHPALAPLRERLAQGIRAHFGGPSSELADEDAPTQPVSPPPVPEVLSDELSEDEPTDPLDPLPEVKDDFFEESAQVRDDLAEDSAAQSTEPGPEPTESPPPEGRPRDSSAVRERPESGKTAPAVGDRLLQSPASPLQAEVGIPPDSDSCPSQPARETSPESNVGPPEPETDPRADGSSEAPRASQHESSAHPSVLRDRSPDRRDAHGLEPSHEESAASDPVDPEEHSAEGALEYSGVGSTDSRGGLLAVASALAAGVVLAGIGLLALRLSSIPSEVRSTVDSVFGSATETRTEGATAVQTESSEVGPAVAAARERIRGARRIDVSDPSLQLEVARGLVESGRPGDAARIYRALWSNGRRNPDLAGAYTDALLASGRYRRARAIAVDSIQAFSESERFTSRFRESLENDPKLGAREPVELAEREDVESLDAAEEIDFSGLVARGAEGVPSFLFAPYDGGEREWRDDVAAWRLCRMIDCRFEIPETRAARVSRTALKQLVGEEFAEWSGSADPVWVEKQGPEGERREYLYGSLREWPGDVARWPMTAKGVWYGWLSDPGEPKDWDASLTDALDDLRDVDGRSHYEAVLEEVRRATPRDLAGQLSDIFVFDFLTNNWNRFYDDDPGAYNHFRAGRFVTLRTATVLQRRNSRRVRGRFDWISQFRRDTVTAIRALDPASIDEMLYPDPSTLERAKTDILRGQRERLLRRVDRLVDAHGRDAIFPFR